VQPEPKPAVREHSGIFTRKVGRYEVYTLVESEREGNTGIIPGASEAVLKRYIPEDGFKQSTNAFLIKDSGRNILVDTGTGADGVILDKMRDLGVTPDQVDVVLLTHLHGDHIGSLQKDGRPVFTRAKVYVSVKERDYFTRTAVNQAVVAALGAYGSNVITFDPLPLGPILTEILPGIRPIAFYGHTPGHTAYLVGTGSLSILIAGDFVHVAPVQFPNPGISATYDIDQWAAAESRRELMDYAAIRKIPVGGMHIEYPGIGMVEADGYGYRFVPIEW
jgi:glyoxylase-like metal-dependent hydrolase (beta-lactamase superfamily II)